MMTRVSSSFASMGGRWPGADSHECRPTPGKREKVTALFRSQAVVSQVHIIERSRPLIPAGAKDLVCAHEGHYASRPKMTEYPDRRVRRAAAWLGARGDGENTGRRSPLHGS